MNTTKRSLMIVTRRDALKQFVIVSAGIMFIPSCVQDKDSALVPLKNLSITRGQEKLLAELSETIIPATDTPGAKDISAHLFVLKMMDDCAGREDQKKFTDGLAEFEKKVKEHSGKSFQDCSVKERQSVVNDLESAKDADNQLAFFYSRVKRFTLQAYSSSQFYLTKVQVYEMVPGRYHGCVPVKISAKKAS